MRSKVRQQIINVAVLVLCLAAPLIIWVYFEKHIPIWFPSLETRSAYGEQFGGLNGLFAGLAAGGVVFTLFLTYQQLRLQRQQLERTSHSLQANQLALAEQTKLLSEEIGRIVPRHHPVTRAEDRFDIADLVLRKAKENLRDEMMWIKPDEKKVTAGTALEESDVAWKKHVDASVGVEIAALSSPSGSRRALALAISIQADLSEERAQQLTVWAEWIRANYQR
jgi:hypothetical protein